MSPSDFTLTASAVHETQCAARYGATRSLLDPMSTTGPEGPKAPRLFITETSR